MLIQEINERGLSVDDDGRVLDEFGNEYRDESGQVCYADPVTIDITPTWQSLLPLYIAVLQAGKERGIADASHELHRMAGAADRWNAHADALVKLARQIAELGAGDEIGNPALLLRVLSTEAAEILAKVNA